MNLALFDGSKKVSHDLKPITLARGEVVCLYVTGGWRHWLAPVWVKRPVKAD
ncbi:hypothetical protein ACPA9J_16630 [Pseudomonas aeruginosa]